MNKNELGSTTPDPSLKPANVKYTGRAVYDRGKRKRIDRNEPIESFSDRGEVFTLPPAADQLQNRFFYHEKAEAIAAAFPHLYKRVIRK
jgi:hypothetical protein